MTFHWNDKEPIYLQLRDLIREMILTGELSEGEALPSVRQVAAEYQLNPITVSKSWQHLVDEGLVEKRRGLGMYVIEGAQNKLMHSEQDDFIEKEWPQIIDKIQKLNIDTGALIESLETLRSTA